MRRPGRLERIENRRGLHVFVDYAHTDDALRSVLQALRRTRDTVQARGRILTVFGCGGDRDRGKTSSDGRRRRGELGCGDRDVRQSSYGRSERDYFRDSDWNA
ncbi:MAG: hypothetical protein HC902_10365 [Calothrix sp. SM1_5_4]|nr:hypothetical protein [Calothrix sp. SM1_5_4]